MQIATMQNETYKTKPTMPKLLNQTSPPLPAPTSPKILSEETV